MPWPDWTPLCVQLTPTSHPDHAVLLSLPPPSPPGLSEGAMTTGCLQTSEETQGKRVSNKKQDLAEEADNERKKTYFFPERVGDLTFMEEPAA